jgi:ribonuclease Z
MVWHDEYSPYLLTIADLVSGIEKGFCGSNQSTNQSKEETMKPAENNPSNGITRRDALKLSGLALGGMAIGSTLIGPGPGDILAAEDCPPVDACNWRTIPLATERYTYYDRLPSYNPLDPNDPNTPLLPNEMRITFMGSCIPPVRRAQQMMSVFVEVGNAMGKPDQFVFDCGSGVCANYGAMGIGFGRMDKVFIAHLHGDHMSDLTHIYCFGPSADRKSPLYVWGPGPSNVDSPKGSGQYYDDGTKAFCENLRKAMRWHSESFSFQSTSYPDYTPPTRESWGLPVEPVPVGDDPPNDAYAMVPIELKWQNYGAEDGDNVAYDNKETGVRITHFPVIHCRQGSIGYKLEWNGLTMIYTSDTKPEIRSRDQAINGGKGVDVFIHEMVIPAEVWAFKNMGLTRPPLPDDLIYPTFLETVEGLKNIQNSSHTPQGAFGYLLSQINPRPRLTVATHFPVANDTVACALNSVQAHCPDIQQIGPQLTWSFDLMVLRVTREQIVQLRADVSDFGFSPVVRMPSDTMNPPKYHDVDGNPDPYAQINRDTEIKPQDEDGNCNYREDGY